MRAAAPVAAPDATCADVAAAAAANAAAATAQATDAAAAAAAAAAAQSQAAAAARATGIDAAAAGFSSQLLLQSGDFKKPPHAYRSRCHESRARRRICMQRMPRRRAADKRSQVTSCAAPLGCGALWLGRTTAQGSLSMASVRPPADAARGCVFS